MSHSLETLPISNSSLQQVVATLNGNLNLTAADLALQLEIAHQLYFSELQFGQETKVLQSQLDIFAHINRTLPAESVDLLVKQIEAERAAIVKERVIERLHVTVESLGEKALTASTLVDNIIKTAGEQLGCNQTCIELCVEYNTLSPV
jgi:hypothetical protein